MECDDFFKEMDLLLQGDGKFLDSFKKKFLDEEKIALKRNIPRDIIWKISGLL